MTWVVPKHAPEIGITVLELLGKVLDVSWRRDERWVKARVPQRAQLVPELSLLSVDWVVQLVREDAWLGGPDEEFSKQGANGRRNERKFVVLLNQSL